MLRPGGLTIRGRKVPDAIGSDMHYSAFLAAPAADTDTYRAVQEDTAVTGVDWQAFHAWTEDDPDFSGVITIRDHNGVDVGTSTRRTPTDPAADQSLTRIGWHRTGPGSRTGTAAATHPSPASASQPSDVATRRAINPSSRAGDQLAPAARHCSRNRYGSRTPSRGLVVVRRAATAPAAARSSFTRIRSTVGAAEVTVVGRLVCPRRRPLPTLTRFSRVAALHATEPCGTPATTSLYE